MAGLRTFVASFVVNFVDKATKLTTKWVLPRDPTGGLPEQADVLER
jgi:hypothetical protein